MAPRLQGWAAEGKMVKHPPGPRRCVTPRADNAWGAVHPGGACSMSDIPGRLREGFLREARETLDEAMRLCERAEGLRADMSRLNVGIAIAADGRTLELLNRRASDGSLTMAIDRFCDAALLLGQTTWCWAQGINVEAAGDLAQFTRMFAAVNGMASSPVAEDGASS